MYTLIRKEEKKRRKYEHLFYVREKPSISIQIIEIRQNDLNGK